MEVATYMKRADDFTPPSNITEFCAAAKQYIVSNHAILLADVESKHMIELDQCKTVSVSAVSIYFQLIPAI